MSFRCRQKFHPASSSSVYEPDETELPSGVIQIGLVNLSEKNMPKPEFFDLKNQVESGLNLEEVNSKVLQPRSVDASKVVRKYTKSNTNKEG